MRRSVGLVLAAAIVLGASPAAVASASSSPAPPVPRVFTCAGRAVVRPASYVLSCADANQYFNGIHWTRWTSTVAVGTATFVQNTCTPTCAQGSFVRYPASLTLSVPKKTPFGLLFSAIRYGYTVTASSTLPLSPLPVVHQRCAADPAVAAMYVIPPAPFAVRDVVVTRTALPPSEPVGKGPSYKRLYTVRFFVLRGNPVLPAGHTFTQFSYVSRASTSAPWCFLKGGSGP